MEISLKHDEMIQAVKDYVEATGIPLANKEVVVDLKAGRGENGHSAHIQILPVTAQKSEDEDSEASEEDSQAIDFDFEEND